MNRELNALGVGVVRVPVEVKVQITKIWLGDKGPASTLEPNHEPRCTL
jgi:hypothetical protein